MENRFLHNHEGMERDKNIDSDHVIVDKKDWDKVQLYIMMIRNNMVSELSSNKQHLIALTTGNYITINKNFKE